MSATAGQASNSGAEIQKLAENRLAGVQSWTTGQKRAAARVVHGLINDLPAVEYCAIGIGGAPGTGKSSLAGLICDVLIDRGTFAISVSLDDYYLGSTQRAQRASIHPLFAQRGVPGTHDWEALMRDLDRISDGDIKDLRLPLFDKASDDRVNPRKFRTLEQQPRVVLLEGWLIGAHPQSTQELLAPINQLEESHDPDLRWRTAVNQRLAEYHRDLSARLDRYWFLAAPGWESVVDWRWRQEIENASLTGRWHLANQAEVVQFLEQFQRIAMHMFNGADAWADQVIDIDEEHLMGLR